MKNELLEVRSDYSKVVWYKVNIQKLIFCLHTSNEQVEFEIKCEMLFILAPQKNQKLRYNSNKICTKSIWRKLQNLMHKIQEELNKWWDIPCSWPGRLIIVKTSVLLYCSTDSIQSQSKSQEVSLWILINCF